MTLIITLAVALVSTAAGALIGYALAVRDLSDPETDGGSL